MKPLLVLLALALSSVGVGACGGASDASMRPTTATARLGVDPEHDGDRPGVLVAGGPHDKDDFGIVYFGQPATASEARFIASLVKRYYAAAAASDGARACALMY